MFQHTVTNVNQFPHGRTQSTHLRFICSQQSVVLGLDVRVLSGRDHCWKIESLAESTVPGLGQPRPAVSGRTGLLLYRIEPPEMKLPQALTQTAATQGHEHGPGSPGANTGNGQEQFVVLL